MAAMSAAWLAAIAAFIAWEVAQGGPWLTFNTFLVAHSQASPVLAWCCRF